MVHVAHVDSSYFILPFMFPFDQFWRHASSFSFSSPCQFVQGWQFWMVVSSLLGVIMTYATVLCNSVNSPLATSVTGNTKDVVSTGIGAAYRNYCSETFDLLVSFDSYCVAFALCALEWSAGPGFEPGSNHVAHVLFGYQAKNASMPVIT